MADLRKEIHGPGSMNGVELVVFAYDNRIAKDKVSGKTTTHYLDLRIHPEDRRAPGQTNLALVSKKDDKSPTGYNNSARYSAGQFEAIEQAAGDNVQPLTNQKGEVVGKIYGIKADLLINNGEVIANTKTVAASELNIEPQGNLDIRGRIFESMKEAKAAKGAVATPEVAAEAAVEAPVAAAEVAAEEKPAAKATAKKPAARKPATRKPAAKAKELVGAGVGTEAPVASSDEPGLG
jgi:hypothetical protein